MSETLRTAKPKVQQTETPAGAAPEHQPTDFAPEELLDWDVWLPIAPPRPTGTVTARLEFIGRDRPIPVEFPDTAEDEEA
jgi:hypothetical protein